MRSEYCSFIVTALQEEDNNNRATPHSGARCYPSLGADESDSTPAQLTCSWRCWSCWAWHSRSAQPTPARTRTPTRHERSAPPATRTTPARTTTRFDVSVRRASAWLPSRAPARFACAPRARDTNQQPPLTVSPTIHTSRNRRTISATMSTWYKPSDASNALRWPELRCANAPNSATPTCDTSANANQRNTCVTSALPCPIGHA